MAEDEICELGWFVLCLEGRRRIGTSSVVGEGSLHRPLATSGHDLGYPFFARKSSGMHFVLVLKFFDK